MRHLSFVVSVLLGVAAAQGTQPHYSTCFGGSVWEEGIVVRRGPGPLVTLVGDSRSGGLATAGSCQPVHAAPGTEDVFVARFDPTQPAGAQLMWCTYLGGTGVDFAFDAHVDQITGVTTVVGLTSSPVFPAGAAGTSPLATNGTSDAFVVQVDPTGSTCTFAMLLGGSNDDHACEVEVDPASGFVTIAGVTDSPNLPAANNALNGPNDAFAASILPVASGVVLWSTYLGGNSTEGWTYGTWAATSPPAYAGNLDRMGLCLDGTGNPVIATVSFTGTVWAPTTANSPGCVSVPAQSVPGGLGEVYLAVLDPAGLRCYATFFGGASDDRPKAIVPHPGGGFAIGGTTSSANLPTTPGCLQPAQQGGYDGFLAWIDPPMGAGGLSYASYLGGAVGEDVVHALAVEPSGVITAVGHTEGGIPVTPRCLEPAAGAGQVHGLLMRVEPARRGSLDLVYGSMVGPVVPPGGAPSVVLRGVELDDYGDAWIAGGASSNASYPAYSTPNAHQPGNAGGRDAVLTHLPLLPGPGTCVRRQQLALATPACGAPPAPLYVGMAGAVVPNTTFALTATNAPPRAPCFLLIGSALSPAVPIPGLNGNLLVFPVALSYFLASDARGYVRLDLPLPATFPLGPCYGLTAQWLFATNAACPGTGVLATSERLDF